MDIEDIIYIPEIICNIYYTEGDVKKQLNKNCNRASASSIINIELLNMCVSKKKISKIMFEQLTCWLSEYDIS